MKGRCICWTLYEFGSRPRENNMAYCCYCGRPLVEAKDEERTT